MDTTINVKVVTDEAERALGKLNSAINLLGFSFTAAAAIDFADSITNVNNKLKQVTGSGAEFNRVQKQLYTIANQTGSAIADTTTLFQKMSLAQDTAGLTGAGVIKMTELVSKQMATVGMTTQETSSFLTQFGQAMSSGRLQGDEFRSMMETNVPMMKMLADSMGVTIGELKNLGSEGKITAKDLTDAFMGSTDAIEKAAGQIDMTIGKAFTVLKNNAMQAFGEMESGNLVVKGITEAILLLANNLKEAVQLALAFVVALAVSKLVSIAKGVDGVSGAFDKLNKTIRANLFVALVTAIVYVGQKIYSDIIEPMRKFGVASGVIGRYVAESLINAFLQVGEAAISLFPAIGKLIADSLTPGKSVTESLKEIDDIYAKILTRRTIKLVSDEELKTINKALEGQKKVADAVKEETDLRKEAQTVLSQQQKEAQKALDAYIKGLERSGVEQKDLVLYGQREAEVRKAIQEQADKLGVTQQSLSQKQRDQIVNAIKLKQEYQDIATTQQAFKSVAQQITLNSIEDVRQRQIQKGLLQYQATVSKEIYAANVGYYETLLKQEQLTDDLNKYKVAMRDLDLEIANLQIKDVREREIQNQLQQYQLQVGKEIYAITGKQYELKIREREAQRLINDEVVKGKGLILGSFYSQIQEIKKTQDAYNEARKKARDYWDTIARGDQSVNAALDQNMKDRQLIEDSLHIQKLEQYRQVAILSGNGHRQAMNQYEIELIQLRALKEAGILLEQDYANARYQIEFKLQDALYQAALANQEKLQRMRLMDQNSTVNGIKLTNEEVKKIAGERAAFEMKTDYQKTQFMVENASTIFNALGAQNKKAFDAAKALNIATAIMNTYRGATIALATYPPPFNFIAAAAVVAAGLAQVAAIRSQTYSGRALGGGVMGGTSYIVGERGPELFTPTNSGKITRNQDLGSGGGTTVNFTVVANDTRGFDELLTARKGLITQIISDAQLEKGRRI